MSGLSDGPASEFRESVAGGLSKGSGSRWTIRSIAETLGAVWIANRQYPSRMTFLPIVERELRASARRPATHWLRFFAALAAIFIWGVVVTCVPRSVAVPQLSQILFLSTGLLALGFCLMAGVFLTADCVSVEKREGTLGLLFLTDLKGYDVVFGKLAATSVESVYGLLATFPVLALPLLLGGVTGGEFSRVVLVLLLTLFLSLALGLFVSTISREARQALTATFLGIVVMSGIFPALWWLQEMAFRRNPIGDVLLLPSPANAFRLAFHQFYDTRRGATEFCVSIGLMAGLGIVLLVLSALLLPRRWQEKGEPPRTKPSILPMLRLPGTRSGLLEANPFQWLAGRDERAGGLAIFVFITAGALWAAFMFGSFVARIEKEAFTGAMFTAYGLHVVWKCVLAVAASRRFSEDRLSGALELLLVTPLSPGSYLSGQRAALKKSFRKSKALLALMNLAMLLLQTTLDMSDHDHATFTLIFLGGIVLLFSDAFALSWIGMEMGLRGKRHHRAVLAALGRVLLPSWLAVFLLVFAGISGPGARMTNATFTGIIAFWFAFSFVVDLMMGLRARRRLQIHFREIAVSAKSNVRDPGPTGTPPTLNFEPQTLNSLKP